MDKLNLLRINLLHPDLRGIAIKTVGQAEQALTGRAIPRITYSLRTFKEQQDLYSLGRTAVNPDGKTRMKPMGNIITNAKAGQSIHNYGLAVDFALIIDGKEASWNTVKDFDADGKADWMEVVSVFKANGWEWGGDWKSFNDKPHFQYDFGYTWQQLQAKHNVGEQKGGYVILTRPQISAVNIFRATTALNFRTGPSTNSRRKLVIMKGESVCELSREGEWSMVAFEQMTGYVNNFYLDK
jgi:peptidoglycan L-alanyl-D-glutamate endopeptidase CwlK